MEKQIQEFYNTLKKFGYQIEFNANEKIQKGLNNEAIIKYVNRQAYSLSKNIDGLKELVEIISIPLNFPTKNDVANVAKLTLQNEEKIDSIQEQLDMLNHSLLELQTEKPSINNSPSEQDRTEARVALQSEEKIDSIHVQLEMLNQYLKEQKETPKVEETNDINQKQKWYQQIWQIYRLLYSYTNSDPRKD